MGKWTNAVQDKDHVHTVPVDDIIEHEHNECPCGPTTEPIKREDGSIGWHILHHSLDGREQFE